MTEECKINKNLILENKPEWNLEQKLKENILRKILKKQKAWNKPLKEQSVSGQDHEKKASSKNMSSEEKVRNVAKGKKKKKEI